MQTVEVREKCNWVTKKKGEGGREGERGSVKVD